MSGFSVPAFDFIYQGLPAASGTLNVYQTGTTTPVIIYSDGGLTTPLSNPMTLDGNGQAKFYVSGAVNLRFDAFTATGTLIQSIDPVYPVGAATVGTVIDQSINLTLSATNAGNNIIATAPITISLPLTTTLSNSFYIDFNAQSGAITLSPTSPDKINLGIAGANYVIAQGSSGRLWTDAMGNWGINFIQPATPKQIQPISASVAASALTISSSALSLDFRSSTLTSGTVTTISGTPSNLVVPSTATLGTVSAIQSRLAILALNNAGTIELAVVNIVGGNDLSETGVISSTTISTGATSTSVVYSTTGRSNVAYRVIGYIESTQATAGTWATAPSTIQGYGGEAFSAMSSIGYGQTYQDVTASRSLGTTFYNTTGKPIMAIVQTHAASGGYFTTITVNGVAVPGSTYPGTGTTTTCNCTAIIPPNAPYSANNNGGTPALDKWIELR